jgi:hypothetical protein
MATYRNSIADITKMISLRQIVHALVLLALFCRTFHTVLVRHGPAGYQKIMSYPATTYDILMLNLPNTIPFTQSTHVWCVWMKEFF